MQKLVLIRDSLPDLNEVNVIPDLRVELTRAVDALLTEGLLDLVVVVASFLQRSVGPVLEPVPAGHGHQGAGALVLTT